MIEPVVSPSPSSSINPAVLQDEAKQKPPTLSVCLIVRNASETLEACLKSVRERAPGAEIVVVDTCSNDYPTFTEDQRKDLLARVGEEGPGTAVHTRSGKLPAFDFDHDDGEKGGLLPASVAIAVRYADKFLQYRGPNGTWNQKMYAFDAADAARNKSFELATGKWVMWIDADDVLPGPEEVQKLLELNGRWKPGGATGLQDGKVVGLEEFLEEIDQDEKFKAIQGFWAPYLYRSDENGKALTWQMRERIVRNNGKWHWQRKAHEVLVPKNPKDHAKLATIAHLLFLHKKKFDVNDQLFSLTRHFNILIADYEKGVRNCQDLLYLENYAIFLCPTRRTEFTAAMFDCANTPVDRARAHIRKAAYAAEQGFFLEAVESYSAAATVSPEYPDSMFALADLYVKAEQYGNAVDWFEKAVAVPPGHPFTDVAPREHLIAGRIKGALAAHAASKQALQAKRTDLAELYADKAFKFAQAAYNEPCIGPDRQEAAGWLGLFENELEAQRVMAKIHATWGYLLRNDETQKARELLKSVPHNLLDHPLVAELEAWARKMDVHLADPEEYQHFYEDITTSVTSNADELTPATALPRVQFAIKKICEAGLGAGSFLEVGPFDGISAIPLMLAFPECEFTGLEIKKSAADALEQRVKEKLKLPNKFQVVHGQLDDAVRVLRRAENKASGEYKGEVEQYDAVVFYEVIEHVADPAKAIDALALHVKEGGLLFVSTPWGAFDRGHQPSPETRDARGHVRAMMPRELIEAIEGRGDFVIEELGGYHGEGNYGDTLHLVARRQPIKGIRNVLARRAPVSFAVAAALWDWNGSHVINTGIGASEETIVYLARRLAADEQGHKARDVRVYGPLPKVYALPSEEVVGRVKYHPREQFRHINPAGPVVVSRAPWMGKQLDKQTGEHLRKFLWLQDAYYPDLNPETAEDYEKIVVLSYWQKQALHEMCNVPLEKFAVIPNFLLKEHFTANQVELADAGVTFYGADGKAKVKREPHRFIYASSPDRGLMRLLKIWPLIKKEYPDATLGVFYGWEGCMKLAGNDAGWNQRHREMRTEYLKLKDQPGIEEHGRVNHARIADEFRRAAAWLYPTDFDETWCSTAMKARAAGCIPVCTPRAALNESALCAQTRFVEDVKEGETWNDYAWRFFTAVKSAVEETPAERLKMAEEAIKQYDLETILPMWTRLFGA